MKPAIANHDLEGPSALNENPPTSDVCWKAKMRVRHNENGSKTEVVSEIPKPTSKEAVAGLKV